MENTYMKTTHIAKVLGYSSDFLLNNRGIIFFEGEHYFTKERRIDWKISKMQEWIENRSLSTQSEEILKLVS